MPQLNSESTVRVRASRRLRLALASAGALLVVALVPGMAAAQPAPLVAVYPSPGTSYNLPGTQIAFRGIPASQIGQVTVVGSKTGVHAGQIDADSDGDGGSFIPSQPFAPGETVTVTTGLNIADASAGTFRFKIVYPSRPILPAALPVAAAGSDGVQHFRSDPSLVPPSLVISRNAAPASQGDIFLSPQYGPLENGPMILDPRGNLLWFLPYPVSEKMLITDFRPQVLGNEPVLTWWQGYTNEGTGEGEGVIYNDNYQQIAVVRAANGLQMDLHEFLITPQGDAYLIAVSPVSLHNPYHKPTLDSVVQEIDINTGLMLFEWHALDHIPLSDSYFTAKSPGYVFDPYHANSVGVDSDGNLIVSLRNTSTVYKINRVTGKIMWELGGRHSSFRMGNGTITAFQHDAVVQPDGTITIFDDGAGPPTVHSFSRGIRVALNTRTMTATLVGQYDHSPQLSANFEGDVQPLSSGDVFLGWGQQPYFSEDNGRGQQIFDAHFTVPTSSYRAYRFPWSGQPTTLPAIAVTPGSDGTTGVYASWNGATDVSGWRVLAGPSPAALTAAWGQPRDGFETSMAVPSQAAYYAVQAIGASGSVLATSATVAAPARIALYGRSVFVAGGATGAIPAGCFTVRACHITTSVYSGRTRVAQTGAEKIAAGGNGLLYFTLDSTGRRLLARARHNRLSVTLTARDSSGIASATSINLISFSTDGRGPRRVFTEPPTLQIIGGMDFVSSTGIGGILAGCYAIAPCAVKTTITAGGRTIANTGAELIGESSLRYLTFSLTGAGRAMLAHAAGNQLDVQVTLAPTSGTSAATATLALARFR